MDTPKKSPFKEIKPESFSDREKRILTFWKAENVFQRSLEQTKDAKPFSIYDGPPFATGLPHYGHLLAGTIKDVVPRYKTMKGFHVPRRFGWDCHGLPVENEIEKELGLSGAQAIEEYGIENFNNKCRSIVLRYTKEWESKVERFGRWVDFSKTWKTMDPTFMESVWWVFKQVYEKGLVYEGFKVMPFSAKLGTPLSNFEANENYKEVDDPSVVVSLPLKEDPTLSLLIWTTTPWTLISNMAVTVGEEIDYVTVETQGKRYLLAEKTLPRWFKEEDKYKVLSKCKGKDLVGKHYLPLFPYFSHLEEKAFRVIADDFVSTEDGTGIVHTAPAFGETDFYACQKHEIPLVCPVDQNGCFTSVIAEYAGLFVKDADKAILQRLKEMGQLFYRGTIHHRYPFCWRSETPLIYKAINTWFLKVEAIKEELIRSNDEVHWTPAHVKQGRFGKWLEGARDWAISRNRYFGTPIPLWRAEDGDVHVVGSVKELEELTGAKIEDLHRESIDSLTFEKNGKLYKRIPEVFDCWFDAGSMPYAQNHFPFEHQDFIEKHFPADFIAEGLDQTRGWFYTLLVLGTALYGKSPYKNVIVNGILLAEDGNKMSKRLKNYPDPEEVVNECGADAVRLYMLHSPAVRGDDLRFSKKGVEVVLRQFLIPLWNAQSFLITYARIYNWFPKEQHKAPKALIDQWILSKLQELIENVEKGMDAYELSQAVEPFVDFIDALTNWYIRRSRRRFWAEEDTLDRQEAFATLYTVLIQLCKIAAPFVPFISEAIYQNLKTEQMDTSVHLAFFPEKEPNLRNFSLEKGMDALQTVVSLGHSLRKEHKRKVRQPLLEAKIMCADPHILSFLMDQKHLIEEELNVKQVHVLQESEELVQLSVKPNFRVLGKKVGKHMKAAQLFIATLEQTTIHKIMEGGNVSVKLGDESFEITKEDLEITRKVQGDWAAMNAGALTLAIETALTEDLILEGIARELVNKVNTMRKEANFEVTDRIRLILGASKKVQKSLEKHGAYLKQEVLAIEIDYQSSAESQQWDINGEPTAISIQKVKTT